MTKQLIIIGAGGLGRETLGWALQTAAVKNEWNVCGFLDGNRKALDGYPVPKGYSVIGDPTTYRPTSNDVFVCGIGDPEIRLKVCRDLQERGAEFTNVIHPTAIIGPECRIGTGNIFCPYVTVSTNVEVGNFVVLSPYASLGHDSTLADGCLLNGKCEVNGNVVLGEGVYMGCLSAVLPSVKVGEYCRIGAGSVVVRNTRARTTLMGVPAKKLFTQTDFNKNVRKTA